ncbi:MAG: ACP S-malonyltransferase [Candidatus Omnitrophica bacterium]|nr:ACP S-malonyltransferase [Candidatus Omnitrophota bacterium]
MREIAFLFPGQGAQFVGMGSDFYREDREAQNIFDQADQQLGFSLSKLCFDGPEAELTRTTHAQIAIFVTSIAILQSIRSGWPHLKPSVVCGLSLGEFTSLVAVEAITFEEGLDLVRRRGELMEKAAQKNPGTMASILGISIADCIQLCKESGAELANINSYEQIVVSGTTQAVNKACELAKTKGAKRAILLKVGGAFHSSLMKDAQKGLEEVLEKVEINEPRGTFIPNVTGEPASDLKTIRSLLAKQLTSPVQWVKTMETVVRFGVKECVEIGPGRVLKGLARKINPELNIISIEKKTDLDQLKPIKVEG